MKSRQDKFDPRFQPYLRLMDVLTSQFGANCQVSLYDMSAGSARLIAVSGTVMELAIGSALPASFLDRLSQAGRTGRMLFTSSTPDGRRLSSSLTLLTDGQNGTLGCMRIDFCIEHLITSIDVLQTFCNFDDGPAPAAKPKADEDIGNLVDTIIADALKARREPRAVSGKAHRIDIVRQLDERGVFLVKGAVEIVSTKLNISKYTIYNYLDQLKKKTSSRYR